MPVDVPSAADSEQRLQEAILLFLKAADSGQPLSQQELLTRYPDLTADLTAFFADQSRLEPVLAPLRGLPDAGLPRAGEVLRSLGDYELLEEIGRGGMGVVYKARQKTPHRLVALKMIRAGELASAAELQRFRNEAQAAAQLDHPNIIPIYEVGEHDRRLFFSMKLIEHGSLADQLDRFQTDARAAATLVAAVAQAVHHAHQLVRGLGTPVANLLVPDLIAGNFPATGRVPAAGAGQLVNSLAAGASAGAPALRSSSSKRTARRCPI
jgi:Protein kinase domain